MPAALLAGTLGLSFEVAGGDFATAARAEIRGASGPVALVVRREQAGDALLFGLLDEVEAFLASERPWAAQPRFGLLTGRDLGALSRLVARTLERRLEPARAARRELAHIAAGPHSAALCEVLSGAGSGRRGVRRELATRELAAVLAAPRAAIAYQTHGFDACAKGGAGVVLCGLRAGELEIEQDRPGILSCGRGHPCPRGPHPLSLRELRTDILMLATCNGLRLADSALTADFNLGLSFLEGSGLGYVGPVFSASGSDLCSLAFLAAIDAGYDLGEATGLVNALLHCSGIERTAYAALGIPDLASGKAAPAPSLPEQRWRQGDAPLRSDLGNARLAEILIEDRDLVRQARAGRLSLAVTAAAGGEVYWFCRAERLPADGPGGGGGDVARAFLFRFPEPLGSVEVTAHDADGLGGDAVASLAGLDRWHELWRLCGQGAAEEDTLRRLAETVGAARQLLARLLPQLRFNGSAPASVRQHIEAIDRTSRLAREWLLAELLPRMTGPFWLTNLLAAEYHYAGARPASCPHCVAAAVGRRSRHPLHGDTRLVDICPRCGIVSDLREGGAIASVVVSAPELAAAGDRVPVDVRIRPRPGQRPVVGAHLRLSTHGLREVVPSPPFVERRLETADDERFEFQVHVPESLPPHQFFLKVMVTTDREAGFASRLLFVVPPTAHGAEVEQGAPKKLASPPAGRN